MWPNPLHTLVLDCLSVSGSIETVPEPILGPHEVGSKKCRICTVVRSCFACCPSIGTPPLLSRPRVQVRTNSTGRDWGWWVGERERRAVAPESENSSHVNAGPVVIPSYCVKRRSGTWSCTDSILVNRASAFIKNLPGAIFGPVLGPYRGDLAPKCGPRRPHLRRGLFGPHFWGQISSVWTPKPVQKLPPEDFELKRSSINQWGVRRPCGKAGEGGKDVNTSTRGGRGHSGRSSVGSCPGKLRNWAGRHGGRFRCDPARRPKSPETLLRNVGIRASLAQTCRADHSSFEGVVSMFRAGLDRQQNITTAPAVCTGNCTPACVRTIVNHSMQSGRRHPHQTPEH